MIHILGVRAYGEDGCGSLVVIHMPNSRLGGCPYDIQWLKNQFLGQEVV